MSSRAYWKKRRELGADSRAGRRSQGLPAPHRNGAHFAGTPPNIDSTQNSTDEITATTLLSFFDMQEKRETRFGLCSTGLVPSKCRQVPRW